MAYITGIDRNQAQLFPELLDEYVDAENPVRVIDAFVSSLDIKKLKFTKTEQNRPGAPSYDPRDMLKLYIYGYSNGIRTSRKLEKATYVNVEVMWLIQKLHPDHKTIANFRRQNKRQLMQVFREFNLLCKDWDLFGGEIVAIDGTKFRADNSKRNNYNKKKIDRQKKYIDEKINEYLNALDCGDQEPEEKPRYTIDEMKKKIEELKERKTFYTDLEQQLERSGADEVSTTDPDSRLMDNKKNGLEVNYNVQIAVDEKNKLILATDVTNNPSDQGHLNDMAQLAKEALGMEETATLEVLADKGYYQADDLKKCDKNNTITYVTHQTYSNGTGNPEYYSEKFKYDRVKDVYICPQGQELRRVNHKKDNPERIKYKNYKACAKCPHKDLCTKSKKGRVISRSCNQDFLDTVDARTAQNMDKYLRRQMIVEHPFGTVKRTMNAGYFLTRGLESVKAETNLLFLAYNMKRVINILGVTEIIRRIEANISLLLNELKNGYIFFFKMNPEKYITVI